MEFVRFQIPVIPQEKMRSILQCIVKNENLDSIDTDELAYVYTLYAQSNKLLGKPSIAAELHNRARTILTSRFEDAINSYALATAYMICAMYYTADNNVDKVDFYLSVVRGFLEKHNINDKYIALQGIYEIITNIIKGNFDMDILAKKFLWQFLSLRSLFQQSDSLGDTHDEIEKIIESEEPLDEPKIHQLSNAMLCLCDKLTGYMEETGLQLRRLIIMFLCHGAILQMHQRTGRFDESTRRAADYISQLTTTPYFNMMPPVACLPLAIAASVHLQFLENCTNSTEREQIMQRLREDLWGMQCLGSWFKIFRHRFQFLFDRVNNAISQMVPKEVERNVPDLTYDFTNTLKNFSVILQDQEQSNESRDIDSLEEFQFEVANDPFLEEAAMMENASDYDDFFDNFQF
jgi:uncharacterized protein YfkK (UPF0435 family)